jgi:ABC-type sulfate/molybdate transport systems ATPase subunit
MGIRVANVSKCFDDFRAVDNVSVDVESGSLVALLGPSGSGKSTLLRLIAGLEQIDAGRIWITGEEATARSVQDRQVGFVFQHFALFKHRNVRQNVAFGLELRRWKQDAIRRRVDELLELVQMQGLGNRYPSQLSGGQRQRVALARALASKPSLLLLDEPLGALDALTRIEMQQLLERLWQEQGFTALLITHDVEEAVVLADRVILIENGQITMNVEIDLPRPRARGDAKFAKTVEGILDRVMGKQESPSTEFLSGFSSSYLLSSLSAYQSF